MCSLKFVVTRKKYEKIFVDIPTTRVIYVNNILMKMYVIILSYNIHKYVKWFFVMILLRLDRLHMNEKKTRLG